jgi:transcriptional/translational regulatory protein YebC/TACO1
VWLQGQVLVKQADEDVVFEAAIEAEADDVQPVFDEDGNATNDFNVCCNPSRQQLFEFKHLLATSLAV